MFSFLSSTLLIATLLTSVLSNPVNKAHDQNNHELESRKGRDPVLYNPRGCFADIPPFRGGRTLVDSHVTALDLTVEKCLAFCLGNGMPYAGLVNGNECRCGYNVNNERCIDDNACNMPCVGDNTQTCGGRWSIKIYQKPSSSNTTCTKPRE